MLGPPTPKYTLPSVGLSTCSLSRTYSLHVCLADECMLCPHVSRIPAPAQYITEPMKTRKIRTRLTIVRHINNERHFRALGTNTTVTPCRCTSGQPYCRLQIPTPYYHHLSRIVRAPHDMLGYNPDHTDTANSRKRSQHARPFSLPSISYQVYM